MLYITRVKEIEGINNKWIWNPRNDGPISIYQRNPNYIVTDEQIQMQALSEDSGERFAEEVGQIVLQ